MICRRSTYLLLILLIARATAAAEPPAPLTLDRIYRGSEFSAKSFSGRWLPDGSAYVTQEDAEGPGGGKDLVAWDPQTGQRQTLVAAALLIPPGRSAPLAIEDYSFSADMGLLLIYTNSQRVWRQNTRGDYWVLDRAARTLQQLGGDAPPGSLMFAKLSPAGHQAAYVRDKNLYLEDLRSRTIAPLTTTGSEDIVNGTFDWVYEEELGLRDGFAWSPDGSTIAFWQLDTSGVQEFTLINNTAGLYPTVQKIRYPKVGQQNSAARLGVIDIASRGTRWLDISGDPREHYLARMQWATNSRELLIQQLNRLQNANRLLLADVQTGRITEVLTERDEAWVDVHDELFWLDDGQRFTWISERDGWRHVYLVPRGGGPPQLATPGEYDVIELLQVDQRSNWLYFLAAPENPAQRYLFRIRLDGTQRQRLTPEDQPGTHRYEIAPDGSWAIHSWSSLDKPPQYELVRLPDYEVVRSLVDNQELLNKLQGLRPVTSEFFRVEIGPAAEPLDAWCLRPPEVDPQKKHPLLIYVYGEPAGQTVVDRWGGSGYLWHRMLAERGYVVMSFDNRGTPAPRGREWRKSVYRQLGVLTAADQAAALEAVLAQRPYLDPQRVGIWGWSGGGSSSLNAIFKYPKLYKLAMAVAPVANQRLYDTIYQERYMGLPTDNVEGYMKGSPINFAHQLEGDLLIVHGTGDDNVHFQATEALIDELIRHNKPFRMMAYPNRSHAIHEGTNTARHLRELLTQYLAEQLPP